MKTGDLVRYAEHPTAVVLGTGIVIDVNPDWDRPIYYVAWTGEQKDHNGTHDDDGCIGHFQGELEVINENW